MSAIGREIEIAVRSSYDTCVTNQSVGGVFKKTPSSRCWKVAKPFSQETTPAALSTTQFFPYHFSAPSFTTSV